ncbi:diguanylate cyclase (GGDEF) domain-containing protein [Pseudobutyrivibrio sp. YE44]|uniref:GGDEF domain-containing protein n=1 Tax=Pseudobutyrivibrio sp. YE44 TaxID=1520802 RepID=UPI0008815861|nr:GGDEF domain-containing protein [Pseudobutyrivibrio sp. YE44]SDB50845.1 diguanylate cyclase (GGDEF) domain-containing protein [Pseudobutyrivibrio sp. YE44]
MIEVPGWVILNFFTSFLLILLLIFQNKTSRLQSGRKYSAILVCTLVLLFSESIGRIGELHPDKYLFLAQIGYYMIFLLDPVDILFAVSYVDCWMANKNSKPRDYFRAAFQAFALINIILVTVSNILNLRWFYYFENNVYYRGEFFMVRAIMVMIFIVLLLIYAVVFRKDFMSEYKNMILFLPIFALIGAVLQVFLSSIDTTYGGISLGCLILFFFFQSNDVNVDYLSGVLNRRGLDIKMEEKIKNAQNFGKDFAAIMMDIDNFKTINDTFGHEEGDKAIKAVADIIAFTFDDAVAIGRFGGDEFCVITDNVSRIEIELMIERVRERIAKVRQKNGWDENVDVSCGYEIYNHNRKTTLSEFTEHIDSLMYNQKQEHHMVQKDG